MKRSALIVAVAVLLTASLAYAGPGRHGQMGPGKGEGMMGPGMGMDGDFVRPGMILRWADEIGLDDNQKAKLDKLAQEHGTARIEKKAELEKAQLKLRHMRMNDAPENEVLAMMDMIGALKTEIRKMGYSHRQALKKVLTDEQLGKIKELRGEWRKSNRPFGGEGSGSGKDFGPGQGRGDGPRGTRDCWRR
jgi:Spy/CpxP family protein refolding chaperone